MKREGLGPKPAKRVSKDKKKQEASESDIFDALINDKATKAPRNSVVTPEIHKNLSNDVRRLPSFFNMSGGRQDSESSSDNAIKELEEENKRLQALIEYKDFELNKKKKGDDFGYDCFSELRAKFDATLKDLEEKNADLKQQLREKDDIIFELQTELKAKDDEISKIDEKYKEIMEGQQRDHKEKLNKMQLKLSTESEEIVEAYKEEVKELTNKIIAVEKEKNKYLDEKLKIEEIIDKQVEQVEYWNNRAMKLEDELSLRKQIEESVTANLKQREEEIRLLKLAKIESVIKSFDVKFINIEESKGTSEVLTKGSVQTCQSKENSKDYFLRITYESLKEKRIKSFRVDAD